MNPLVLANRLEPTVYRLDLNPETGASARELFLAGASHFISTIEETIPFTPGYKPEDDECFEITNFALDPAILATCGNPLSTERIESSEFSNLDIYGLVGYDFSNGQNKIYFQNFDSRRVLVPGTKFAVWRMTDASTFQELDKPILILDKKISAIWDNGNLKFKSFHMAKQLFDLSAYFQEATDEQLTDFSTSSRIKCDDPVAFKAACNSWSRTKIAMILGGGVLNNVTANHVTTAAQNVNYQIQMDGDRIVLPTEKRQLRALLQFLDEDMFRGALSQRVLLSSGKRELSGS